MANNDIRKVSGRDLLVDDYEQNLKEWNHDSNVEKNEKIFDKCLNKGKQSMTNNINTIGLDYDAVAHKYAKMTHIHFKQVKVIKERPDLSKRVNHDKKCKENEKIFDECLNQEQKRHNK